MGWKNLAGWLQGGIILFIMDLIVILIGAILTRNFSGAGGFYLLITQFPGVLLFWVLNWIPNQLGIGTGGLYEIISIILCGLIVWSAIGALIGFIISKLKSKKLIQTKK